jgi:hypothetical protein
MYEFLIGFVAGAGIAWFRKTASRRDAACQVVPQGPTKPITVPGPVRKGLPELAHFWERD